MVTGAVAFCVVVCYAVAFADRGFELSDEAYYLYCSLNPYSDGFLSSRFGLLNHIVCGGHPTLVSLRLARMLLQVSATAFFSASLLRFAKRSGIVVPLSGRVQILLLLVLASFVNYDYLPMTLSYNSWSFILSLLFSGILLFSFHEQRRGRYLLHAFLSGLLFAGLILAKLPNAIVLFLVWLCTHIFFARQTLIMRLTGFFTGILTAYVLLLWQTPLNQVLFKDYYALLFKVRHTTGSAFWSQLLDLGFLLQRTVVPMILVLPLLTWLMRKALPAGAFPFSLLALSAVSLLSTIPFLPGNSQALHYNFTIQLIFLVCTVNYFSFAERGVHQSGRMHAYLLTLLAAMPLLLALGTSNPFYYTASQYFPFWMACIVIAALFARPAGDGYLSVVLIVFGALLLPLLWNGAVKSPYRQGNLTEKNTLVRAGAAGEIKEDAGRATDYRAIAAAITKLNPQGMPILAFSNYIGAALLANVELEPASWLTDYEPSIKSLEHILGERNGGLPELLLIPSHVLLQKVTMAAFQKSGIRPGENYELAERQPLTSTKDTIVYYKLIRSTGQ
jgi:hypothetical protein